MDDDRGWFWWLAGTDPLNQVPLLQPWIGPDGEFLGMHTFGESGPAKDVYEHFGITAPRAAELGRRVLDAAGARAAG